MAGTDATGAFADLGKSKYLRLTTFRRDGTPVSTAVWVVPEGQELLVITGSATGKAKRLRHTSRVLVAPSDGRGRVKPGVQDVEGRAVLVEDPAEVERLRALILKRYGLFGRVAMWSQERKAAKSPDSHGVQVRISAP
jgi:PPOX class probable F420-dependent enzyme